MAVDCFGYRLAVQLRAPTPRTTEYVVMEHTLSGVASNAIIVLFVCPRIFITTTTESIIHRYRREPGLRSLCGEPNLDLPTRARFCLKFLFGQWQIDLSLGFIYH